MDIRRRSSLKIAALGTISPAFLGAVPARACSFGGPVVARPLDEARAMYESIGSELPAYLDKKYGAGVWQMDMEDRIKIICPDLAESHELIPISVEFLGNDAPYIHLDIILEAQLPMLDSPQVKKAERSRHVPAQSHALLAHFPEAGVHRFSVRVRAYERGMKAVAAVRLQRPTGEQVLVAEKKFRTAINTCGFRYWTQTRQLAVAFNREQWKAWNNYFFESYESYANWLGAWMEDRPETLAP